MRVYVQTHEFGLLFSWISVACSTLWHKILDPIVTVFRSSSQERQVHPVRSNVTLGESERIHS